MEVQEDRHVHSFLSVIGGRIDAKGSPEQYLRLARKMGLSIWPSEHYPVGDPTATNPPKVWRVWKREAERLGVEVRPGLEVDLGGVEMRFHPYGEEEMKEAAGRIDAVDLLEFVERLTGLGRIEVPHPVAQPRRLDDLLEIARRYGLPLELNPWQGPWGNRLTVLLARKLGLPLTAGSDAHHPYQLGTAGLRGGEPFVRGLKIPMELLRFKVRTDPSAVAKLIFGLPALQVYSLIKLLKEL